MITQHSKCPECNSTKLSWFPHLRKTTPVVDGRLTMHDITCDFVLGCDECSETIEITPAETIAHHLTNTHFPTRKT